MVIELRDKFGTIEVSRLLGVPGRTCESWLQGRYLEKVTARRVIWLHWCLLLHPERIQTAFDLATWGRFRVVNVPRPAATGPVEWSDWII